MPRGYILYIHFQGLAILNDKKKTLMARINPIFVERL